MENVSRVLSRIDTIEHRLGVDRNAGFRAALDARLGTRPAAVQSGTADVPAAAFGTMFTGSGLLPVAAPTAGSVATPSVLEDYLATHGIEGRNGSLGTDDLVSITGAFDDRAARLLPPAAAAWEAMRSSASRDGVDLRVVDTYRSWDAQADGHQQYLSGEKGAYVAPPGESLHGEGLAVDVTNGGLVGPGSVEWSWLRDHASAYGWSPISNESWHWEFRGRP